MGVGGGGGAGGGGGGGAGWGGGGAGGGGGLDGSRLSHLLRCNFPSLCPSDPIQTEREQTLKS